MLEQAALDHCSVPVFRVTQNLMGHNPEQLAVVDSASAEVLDSMYDLQRSLPNSRMPCILFHLFSIGGRWALHILVVEQLTRGA